MSSLIIGNNFFKNKRIQVENIISDNMLSLIIECYERGCDNSLNMSSQKLPRQWNQVLDDIFVVTCLRQLSLQIQL